MLAVPYSVREFSKKTPSYSMGYANTLGVLRLRAHPFGEVQLVAALRSEAVTFLMLFSNLHSNHRYFYRLVGLRCGHGKDGK